MAIFEEKMYGIACDNCGEICEDGEGHNVWPDKESAIVNALEWGDWIDHEDKYYCSNCFEIDEDDNVIIKSKKEVEYECTNNNPYGLHEYKEGCRQHCDDCDYYQPIQSKK